MSIIHCEICGIQAAPILYSFIVCAFKDIFSVLQIDLESKSAIDVCYQIEFFNIAVLVGNPQFYFLIWDTNVVFIQQKQLEIGIALIENSAF